jgi:membrane protein involved in colicin uptake
MATLTLSGAAAIASAAGAVAGAGLAYKQGADANSAAVEQEAAQKAAKKKAVRQREGAARAALGADNNSLFDILGSAQSNK